MDTAYKNALHKKRELEKELKKVNRFLELYQEFSEFVEQTGTERKHDRTLSSGVAKASLQPAIPRSPWEEDELRLDTPQSDRSLRINEFTEVVRDILLDVGKPLSRSQIVAELEARGYTIMAKDKSNYVGTNMFRRKRHFVNIEGYGYWPRETPYYPANYYPGNIKEEGPAE